MNYKPTPKLLENYFGEEIKHLIPFEIKPDSKARLLKKFSDETIPDQLHEDLLWIWGYMKTMYDPKIYDTRLDRAMIDEDKKREMKSKETAEVFQLWENRQKLSALFSYDEIESISINYKPVRGKFLKDVKKNITNEDFIRFICEAVAEYEILTKESTGVYLAMQAHKANEINYYKEPILSRDDIDLRIKRQDAKKLFWFLKEHLPTFSDRAIFRFGAWLMFDAGVRFKDAYEAVPVSDATYDVEKASLTFGFWANARGKQATQKNPFLIDDTFEDFMREYGDV